jgi:Ca2+-binding RTX toxin-like protein
LLGWGDNRDPGPPENNGVDQNVYSGVFVPAPPEEDPSSLCSRERASSGDDEILIGDNGANQICGFGGNDTLRGLNGADTLRGGPGKDIHAGGKGKDNLKGGPGRDVMRGGKGPDVLSDRKGKNSFIGGKGNDLCKGRGTFKGCESIRQRGR